MWSIEKKQKFGAYFESGNQTKAYKEMAFGVRSKAKNKMAGQDWGERRPGQKKQNHGCEMGNINKKKSHPKPL